MPPHEQLASSSPEFASNITAEIPGKPALALSGTRAPHAPALLSPAARRLAAGLRMAMCGLTACPLLAASNWKRKCQTRYNEFSPLPSLAFLLTAPALAVSMDKSANPPGGVQDRDREHADRNFCLSAGVLERKVLHCASVSWQNHCGL
jgi:hypothetical protein